MLSRETLETYRRMSVSERIALTLKFSAEKFPLLLQGTPKQVERRFELLRQNKDERNRLILEGLACTKPDAERYERPAGQAIDAELAKDPVIAMQVEEWL